jgi:hypothetical protein
MQFSAKHIRRLFKGLEDGFKIFHSHSTTFNKIRHLVFRQKYKKPLFYRVFGQNYITLFRTISFYALNWKDEEWYCK